MKDNPLILKEEDFLEQVIDLAHIYGWYVAHFRPARTAFGWRTAVSADGAGFPDLVMVKGLRLIFAELKSEKAKLSPAQAEWIEMLKLTLAEVYIFRPSQFDALVEILKGGAKC